MVLFLKQVLFLKLSKSPLILSSTSGRLYCFSIRISVPREQGLVHIVVILLKKYLLNTTIPILVEVLGVSLGFKIKFSFN